MQPAFQQVNDEVYLSFCNTLDTPVALSCYLLYKHGEFRQLIEKDIDAGNYNNALSFSKDYAAISYFSKSKWLNTGIDLEATALLGFHLAEDQCRMTNERIKELSSGYKHAAFNSILHAAQRKIARILGPFDIRKTLESCNWGPGANIGLIRRYSQPDNKMHVLPITTTLKTLPYIKVWLEHDPHWFNALTGTLPTGPYSVLPSCFDIVFGNKVITVPKSAKTHRVIATEPMANSFLQKGVGSYIRKRLKYCGVDLDDQSVNQVLAARACNEKLATLDLKAASDTVSYELIASLVPIDWFIYLDSLRSPIGSLPTGEWIKYHKFSSMGNAFTFELESLIFYAISSSVSEDPVSVYGDDLIVSQKDAAKIISVLEFCGFTTNSKKSHVSGRFFESCGKHYFDNTDVTPVYQKKFIDNIPECFRAHNRLKRLQQRLYFKSKPLRVLRQWARTIRKDIDTFEIHIDGFTDDAFLVDHIPSSSVRDIHGVWRFRVLRLEKITRNRRDPGALANYLRNSLPWRKPSDHHEKFVTLRDGTRLKAKRMLVYPFG